MPWKRVSDDGDAGMMGQQGCVQDQLFYAFDLDRFVPSDHLLRGIDHDRLAVVGEKAGRTLEKSTSTPFIDYRVE